MSHALLKMVTFSQTQSQSNSTSFLRFSEIIYLCSFCTRFQQNDALLEVGGHHIGCFKQDPHEPILTGFVRRNWTLNHPNSCVRMCSKAGFAGAGVSRGRDCYCGNNLPSKEKRYNVNRFWISRHLL